MAASAFDQDPNLEDDYHVFADNIDLEDEEDKADLDGVAELDRAEIDGVEFDRINFDGVDLDGVDLDGTERDDANLLALDVNVLDECFCRG